MNQSAMVTTKTVSVDGWNLLVGDDDEPMVLDEELARRLGYARPRKVRDLIRRLFNDSDVRPTVGRTVVGVAERTVVTYHLTEAQALKVIAKSDTAVADAILDEVIDVFIKARKGLLLPRAQPLSLDIAHGPRVGDVPNVREDLSALCAMTARASGHSLRRIHGFLRRTYRVPGIHHIALVLYPAVKQTLEAIGLGRLHLARALPAAPVDKRQLALWKVN